ncbi:hypothetical protein FRC02_005292 [Tulasnella sp. 418]|nr:hypothetical protein FRC02_005292 [Tulasnella sp. 418]
MWSALPLLSRSRGLFQSNNRHQDLAQAWWVAGGYHACDGISSTNPESSILYFFAGIKVFNLPGPQDVVQA